ncbi:MAG: FG-GAP-like repeat-containing protein [Salinibacter sp.]
MERDDVFQNSPPGRRPLALDQGTLLDDQFRVGRVLGVGGFGITYLAFDEVLEMVVAVKEFLPSNLAVRKTGTNTVQPRSSGEGADDFAFGLRRFLQEARTLAKFEAHPNIVRVRTFFRENGTGYLVMNFYEGRTLSEYLAARNGFLPEGEALLVMEQVVEGLGAVHGEDILHRDIDPENVYLADNGTVVLLDFGAARTAVGGRTQSMSVVLKRGYAPHEQYHSHGDQGPWTDVYACSATLYRTLTGYKPPEAAARILEDDLAPPKELVPSLSAATNEAVLEGLAVRPGDRPQTMEAFASRLPELSDGADPGWIGEQTTLEAPALDGEGASAELQVSSTHACRLYVDGGQAAELEPEEAYVLGVEAGTHRLRAVRTDQTHVGNATVTASGPPVQGTTDERRMSLDALMWEEVVSASTGEPTTVCIDFQELPAPADPASDAGRGDEAVDPGAPDAPNGQAVVERQRPAGATSRETAARDDRDDETGTVPAHVRVQANRAAHLYVDDARNGRLGPDDEHRIALSPGEHRVWAIAADGEARWRRTVTVEAGQDRRLEIRFDDKAPWFDDALLRKAPLRSLGVGAGVLIAALMVGWWMFGNRAPRPQPDRVLTTTEEVLVDLTANDADPEGERVRVTAAGPVPDSVADVTVVDSVQVRVRLAAGFAGTATIPYEATDPDGGTARSAVTLRVPFNGGQHPISEDVQQPQVVHADSLGGDDDLDVLVAALGEQAVTWSENMLSGAGRFRAPVTIDSTTGGAVDATTADLNGDGRVDAVSASMQDDVVAWYENRDGTFGEARPLDTEAGGAVAVRTADLTRDGDTDVVAGHLLDRTVTWYENQGAGQFGEGSVVVDSVQGLETLHISDLDADDVPDVLVVSYKDSTIARYEPERQADSVRFVQRPPVGTNLREPIEVHTADVLGNGRKDVLAGKVGEEPLVLYENRAEGANQPTFGNKRILSTGLRTIEEIDTGDIDGDGDLDIFVASFKSDRVAWFENLGDGTFGPAQPVATGVPNVISLTVADVDQDGDVDVLAASQTGNRVGWYENHLVE